MAMSTADETPTDIGAHQLASTVFKNFILKNKTEGSTWLLIDQGLRQHAKTAFLTMLAHQN